ncbi:hypothetical protein OY671_008394, partial [Metschnikowia pulcherrima]
GHDGRVHRHQLLLHRRGSPLPRPLRRTHPDPGRPGRAHGRDRGRDADLRGRTGSLDPPPSQPMVSLLSLSGRSGAERAAGGSHQRL